MISGAVFFGLPVYNNGLVNTRLGWRSNSVFSLREFLVSLPLFLAVLLTPILLHLALVFPKELRIVNKYPAIIRWIYWVPFFSFVAMIVLAVFDGGKGLHAGYGVWLVLTAIVGGVVLVLRTMTRRRAWKSWCINHPVITLLVLCAGLLWIQVTAGFVPGFSNSRTIKTAVPLLVLLVPSLSLVVSILGYPLATCWALLVNYRGSGAEEKRQMKWPLWGVVVSLAGRLLLRLMVLGLVAIMGFKRFFTGPVITAQDILGALLAALIPVSFAVAIFKYRLMEIDLIIRRTVLYSLLTGIVVALYFGLVGGLGGLLVRFTGMKGEWVSVMATVLVAAAFLPIRTRVQGMVDRRFFRKRHDYPQILKALQEQMLEATSLKDLPGLVVESAQRALMVRTVAFFVSNEADVLRVAAKIGLPDQTLGMLTLDPGNESVRGLIGVHEILELNWPQEDQAGLQCTGAKILAAVRFKGELLGILCLGTKLSAEEYDQEDREFLASLAGQVAAAMDTQRLREQERDFEKGREIQQALLPMKIPSVDGYSIAGAWQPARSVSGDYYDVFRLGDRKLALCIADVAGKGLPAALLMSNLQAAVKSIATDAVEPKKLCQTINRVICGNLVEGRFISLFFALLDPPARKLVYTNAGHNAPVLVRNDNAVIRLEKGGPVLGVFPSAAFEQGELELTAGDRLLLFTDGVSEAANSEQEEFGEERLSRLLRESPPETAAALQSRVMGEVTQFCANRFQDDATVVVMVVNEQAAFTAGAAERFGVASPLI